MAGGGENLLTDNFFCNDLATGGDLRIDGGAFALPIRGNKYIFLGLNHLYPPPSGQCSTHQLYYNLIDMNKKDGLGEITQRKQILLEGGCYQVASATRHANGRDWWIILPDNKNHRFFRWFCTDQGVITGPKIQEIENKTIDGLWFCGWITFSPDGQKYLINNCRKGVMMYDFDRCTGLLSNPNILPRTVNNSNWWNYGAAVSSNNRFLYTTNNGSKELEQYDLQADDVIKSKEIVGNFDFFVDSLGYPTLYGFIQNGSDGKVYIWAGDTYYMHVIDQPNKKGVSCKLKDRAIQLPARTFGANMYYPNYRLGPLDGSPCDTLGLDNHPVAEFRYDAYDSTKIRALQFTDVSWYEPAYWRWDFGDPASGTANKSTEQNPAHEFSKAGGYSVCLIASNQYASDTICKKVWVGVSNTHALPALSQARVSPNPATDHLRVSLPALLPAHALRFTLTDVQGRVLREVQLTDFETDISVGNLPKGLYFWYLKVDGEVVQAGKVVKD